MYASCMISYFICNIYKFSKHSYIFALIIQENIGIKFNLDFIDLNLPSTKENYDNDGFTVNTDTTGFTLILKYHQTSIILKNLNSKKPFLGMRSINLIEKRVFLF